MKAPFNYLMWFRYYYKSAFSARSADIFYFGKYFSGYNVFSIDFNVDYCKLSIMLFGSYEGIKKIFLSNMLIIV